MTTDIKEIENKLWAAADELRANSRLKASEYSIPVLGLIFLRYADKRFGELETEFASKGSGRQKIGKDNYKAKGVLYLAEEARFKTLLHLPEGADIGKALNGAILLTDHPSGNSCRTSSTGRCPLLPEPSVVAL